ncbi:hypothetical protein ATER59S_00999 [Aquamicrobium terrae]
MKRRIVMGLAILLGIGVVAYAQTAPFDMSPEGGQEDGLLKLSPNAQFGPLDPPASDGTRVPLSTEQEPQSDLAPLQGLDRLRSTAFRRYIVHDPQFVMTGENDRRNWAITLTPEQAATGAELQIGYQNSIVAAPELSSLKVVINNAIVIDRPISSANGVTTLNAKIPAGLLRSGSNLISIAAVMRHRTDCTITSTNELWTEIDPSRSFLTFEAADAGQFRRIDDIAAIGVDEQGVTEFVIVVPAADHALTVAPIIRLAEGLALMANMPNQSVQVMSAPVQKSGPGRLTVAVGTPAELASVLRASPAGASISSVANFVDDPGLGDPILVVSGPTWNVIAAAIETIVQSVDRAAAAPRPVLATRAWLAPDTRLFTGAGSATFDELGAETQEFSGRRFRTDFAVGIPADFYANAYGEATILLDAAYSQEVLQGSRIDVYVNGNMASTVPITDAGGGIFRHLPVKVTMRHLRPGANIITLEAVLFTSADDICSPGATGLDSPRFALFDTSEFRMPEFARIGRRPDLAGISGTGFPYDRLQSPVPLFIERGNISAVSAAATLLGRMSVAAGRLIPVDLTLTPAAAAGRDAIFVGTIDSLQPQLLSDLGVADQARAAWGHAVGGAEAPLGEVETRQMFNRWREQLSEGGWRGNVTAFEEWVSRNFDITSDTLQLRPRKNPAFMPANDVTFFMAQRPSPMGTGTWTVATAPTNEALDSGIKTLVARDTWNLISGRVTTLRHAEPRVGNEQVGGFQFVVTQPPTFANYRLILANWLSANTLLYAVALTMFCVFLGIATKALLSIFGRRQ